MELQERFLRHEVPEEISQPLSRGLSDLLMRYARMEEANYEYLCQQIDALQPAPDPVLVQTYEAWTPTVTAGGAVHVYDVGTDTDVTDRDYARDPSDTAGQPAFSGIAFSRVTGELWIAETAVNALYRYDPDDLGTAVEPLERISTQGTPDGLGLAFDDEDFLWLTGGTALRRYDISGGTLSVDKSLTITGVEGGFGVIDIAFDSVGTLYGIEYLDEYDKLYTIDKDTGAATLVVDLGANQTRRGIAMDPEDRMWVANATAQQFQRVNLSTGAVEEQVGSGLSTSMRSLDFRWSFT